jgi:hypothetical protein
MRPTPRDPATAALFRDLERMVTISETAGWDVDRLEVENLLGQALDSVCRVPRLDRRVLAGWLTDRLAASGGSAAAAWRARGKDLDAIEDELVYERVRMLLVRADEVADADCPFYLEPEPGFPGRQMSNGRWQVTLTTGGKGILVHGAERTDVRFGAAGRLLAGYVTKAGLGLQLGAELGTSASVPKNEDGVRVGLIVAADLVVPLVVRWTFLNSYLEGSAGWIGRATERDFSDIEHGAHLGLAFGARALRTRFVFPGAGFGLSVERFGGAEPSWQIKLGARASFDIDF